MHWNDDTIAAQFFEKHAVHQLERLGLIHVLVETVTNDNGSGNDIRLLLHYGG